MSEQRPRDAVRRGFETLSSTNSTLPPAFAIASPSTWRGEAMVKAGGGPPVEPELSLLPVFLSLILPEPLHFSLPGHDLSLVQRGDVWLGSALADHPLFTVGERLSARQALAVVDFVQRRGRPASACA